MDSRGVCSCPDRQIRRTLRFPSRSGTHVLHPCGWRVFGGVFLVVLADPSTGPFPLMIQRGAGVSAEDPLALMNNGTLKHLSNVRVLNGTYARVSGNGAQ